MGVGVYDKAYNVLGLRAIYRVTAEESGHTCVNMCT